MLDIIRLIFYFIGIKALLRTTHKYCDKVDSVETTSTEVSRDGLTEQNPEKYIFFISLFFSGLSLIWYKTVYINFIYHFYVVTTFISKKYRIDISQYQWIIDGLRNSDDETMRYFSDLYSTYFRRYAYLIQGSSSANDNKIKITIDKYIIKVLNYINLFAIPLFFFLEYTGERYEHLSLIIILSFVYKFGIMGKINWVRVFNYAFFLGYLFTADQLCAYLYLFGFCMVTNKIFYYGIPDKLKELFGFLPREYCRYCKDGLTNNTLEAVLIDHNIINRRPHIKCYCRYVYQLKVKYYFEIILNAVIGGYMLFTLKSDVNEWFALIYYITYSKLIINYFAELKIFIAFLFYPFMLYFTKGFTDTLMSYYLFLIMFLGVIINDNFDIDIGSRLNNFLNVFRLAYGVRDVDRFRG